jgi:hypothetical protein
MEAAADHDGEGWLMKIKMHTDTGDVLIDPATILQFWPIARDTTAVEHETDGSIVVSYVNHPMLSVARCIAVVEDRP